jgi:hypothetical protein
MYESPNAMPTDLDACGGHYGPVPATTLSDGTVYPAASNVYHYHVQHRPVRSRAFFPLRGTGTTTMFALVPSPHPSYPSFSLCPEHLVAQTRAAVHNRLLWPRQQP